MSQLEMSHVHCMYYSHIIPGQRFGNYSTSLAVLYAKAFINKTGSTLRLILTKPEVRLS